LQTEAHGDIWAHPPGSHGTLLAAREVYRFLGVENRILANYRYGIHAHTPEEYDILADVIDCIRDKKDPRPSLLYDLFPEMREIFDWKCP